LDFDFDALAQCVGGICDERIAGVEAGENFDFVAEIAAEFHGPEIDRVLRINSHHPLAVGADHDGVAGDKQRAPAFRQLESANMPGSNSREGVQ
jgi:hypothetical protein